MVSPDHHFDARTPGSQLSSDELPVLVVVFDKGAASAAELAVGLGDAAHLVFAVPQSDYIEPLLPTLGELGAVVELSDDEERDAEVLRPLSPSGIVTFSESRLRLAAGIAERLGLPFHSPSTALALTDKYRQRSALNAAGVSPVRTAVVREPAEWHDAWATVGLPAVVKPVRGEGSRDTFFVESTAEAARVQEKVTDRGRLTGPVVVEEFLRGRPSTPYGDFVSVESVSGPQGVRHIAVTGKFPQEYPFRERGQFWPSTLTSEEEQEVCLLAGEALAALRVQRGMTHTEIKLTPDGPRVIEVNGRLGGNIQDLSVRSGTGNPVRAGGLLALDAPDGLATARPDRVFFQYIYLAPTQPCTMTTAHGLAEVRRLPGVVRYLTYVQPGDLLPGGVGTQRLGHLRGEAPDHESMFGILDKALTMLSYDFKGPDGSVFTLRRSLPSS
ncbi:ATP-grasp domain-containing protein [Streptomyces sp. NBC_01590]|uniref:ATP-grasp domain-containing protein n=1 Tax=Streptomyces sp. NBC_01590 TaxID=2975887 RepID=UPI00386D9F33